MRNGKSYNTTRGLFRVRTSERSFFYVRLLLIISLCICFCKCTDMEIIMQAVILS